MQWEGENGGERMLWGQSTTGTPPLEDTVCDPGQGEHTQSWSRRKEGPWALLQAQP